MTVDKSGIASKSSHYQAGEVQPIDLIISQKLDFCTGSAIKYLCRFKFKGTPLADLDKVQQYVKWIIEDYKQQNPGATL